MVTAPGPRQGLLLAAATVLVLIFFTFARNDLHPISHVQSQVAAWSHSASASASAPKHAYSPDSRSSKPSKKIWQTAKSGAYDLDEQSQTNIKRWTKANPDWRYELITDYGMDTYVIDRFANDPDIVEVFTSLGDSILRADFIRYLVLLADGGIYSDLDTECLKPIEEWLPTSFGDKSHTMDSIDASQNLAVVGVEYDTFGQGHVGALLDLQLINWTLMSRKAGHGLYATVARRVVTALRELAANQSVPLEKIQANFNEVLANTGPAMLTLSTWEYLSEKTGWTFDWHNVTGITEPLQVEDVIILPVTSWGNGQAHSKAGQPDDPMALVHHQFKGGWKTGGHSWEHVKGAKEMGGHKRWR